MSESKAPRGLTAALLVLLAVNAALLLAGEVAFGSKEQSAGASIKVGLVFDVGGRGDKSFNDLAYEGLRRAREELGVDFEYLEPGEGADREAGLRQFAAKGFDLVIGVGFIFSADIVAIAKEYPDKKFACVDFAPQFDDKGNELPVPPNVAALKFREEEGSFLVGALAGRKTKTRAVGFVGGMTIPLIEKFEAGYAAGVKATCPDCRVYVNYAGSDPSAFKNPAKGKEHALAQSERGADVIFHASGSTGLGVFEAAREKGLLAIGVDANQYSEMPGYVFTSMMKGVDVAVFETTRRVAEGGFEGGTEIFGLKEKGVGYVYDEHNKSQDGPDARLYLSPEDIEAVEALKEKIVAGEIKVPTTPAK